MTGSRNGPWIFCSHARAALRANERNRDVLVVSVDKIQCAVHRDAVHGSGERHVLRLRDTSCHAPLREQRADAGGAGRFLEDARVVVTLGDRDAERARQKKRTHIHEIEALR